MGTFLILLPVLIVVAAVAKKVSRVIGVSSFYVLATMVVWFFGYLLLYKVESTEAKEYVIVFFLPFLLMAAWRLSVAIMRWAIKTLEE